MNKRRLNKEAFEEASAKLKELKEKGISNARAINDSEQNVSELKEQLARSIANKDR